MYRYDNYTDSFIRIDGEPNTGTTTVRVGVPLKESVIVQKTELTDECIDRIADAVVRKLADRKTENSSEKPNDLSEFPTGSADTQTYITEDRDTQILDAWQVKQMQTERSSE